MLVDKQSELMSDLLFTVHQHGGDDVMWKPPIGYFLLIHKIEFSLIFSIIFFTITLCLMD